MFPTISICTLLTSSESVFHIISPLNIKIRDYFIKRMKFFCNMAFIIYCNTLLSGEILP